MGDNYDTCIRRGLSRRHNYFFAWFISVWLSTAGFIYVDPELGPRGPNAAKSRLNHAPFGFRALQLAVRGGDYRN
jgi:hypothetical protein